MFSRLIVDAASVILASSGLGAFAGGLAGVLRFGNSDLGHAISAGQIRASGYAGGVAGAIALVLDLVIQLG